MSITYVKTRPDPKGLTLAISETLVDGLDPRSFRKGFAESFLVSLDDVDAEIERQGVPDAEELSLRNRSRVYGTYEQNPLSEHDEC